MYWHVKKTLEKHRYKQYEISNFSKVGYESKHNTDCWKQKEYLAFGLAAHSYIDDVRYSNTCDLSKYIQDNINMHNNKEVEEIQDKQIIMTEFVILGLRITNGFSIKDFEKKFGEKFEEKYKNQIDKLVKMELIQFKNNNISLSKKGIDFANIVWCEFV